MLTIIPCTASTYVTEQYVNSTGYGRERLYLGYSYTYYRHHVFLQFADLSGIRGTVTAAKLKLYITEDTGAYRYDLPIRPCRVTQAYDIVKLSYARHAGLIDTTQPVQRILADTDDDGEPDGGNRWVELDVLPIVQAMLTSNHGLALQAQREHGTYCNTIGKDGDFAPYLLIEQQVSSLYYHHPNDGIKSGEVYVQQRGGLRSATEILSVGADGTLIRGGSQ
ncbi:MAG: DNRLRE domain-containing protein [Eubacteriales bacterium]|nr:DNRLRE domain-containing protein [Eubacteriales bacterium]